MVCKGIGLTLQCRASDHLWLRHRPASATSTGCWVLCSYGRP